MSKTQWDTFVEIQHDGSGAQYRLRHADGTMVVIGDGEDDYWTLAGIIDARLTT